jgi:hypothetical protein
MKMLSKPPRHLKGFYSRKIRAIYDRHPKLIYRAGIGIATVLTVIIIAGFIPFSTGTVRNKVKMECERYLADNCSIKRITLVPWRGLFIDSLVLLKKDNGAELLTTVPRMRLSYRIMPILFGSGSKKRFEVEGPEFHAALPESSPALAGKKQGRRFCADDIRTMLSEFPYSFAVRAVSIDNGDFTLYRRGKRQVEAAGVDVSMDVSFDESLLLQGKISVHCLRLNGLWNVTRLRAKLAVNDLKVALSQCKGDFYGGNVDASGGADMSAGTLENFHCELSRVNLKELYEGSRIGRGECSGRLDGKIDMGESALAPDSLKGRGNVMLSNLEVRDLPIQNSLVVFIAVPKLRDIRFSRFSADLDVRNGKINTPDIHGDGEPLSVRSDGWVGFDGYFFQRCHGVFSGDFSSGLSPIVARSLDEEEDGRRSFNCTVSGTLKNPQLNVDGKIVDRAVKNVFDEVARGLGKLFKR